MDDLIKRQKDFYQGLWVVTIFLILLTIAMWIIPAFSNEVDLKTKKDITISIIICIPLGWIFFYYQKKKDEGKVKQKGSITEGYFERNNIINGYWLKFYSLNYSVFIVVFILFGLYVLIFHRIYWWIGVMLIVMGFLLPIAIRGLWNLGEQRQKGRLY
ncbi:MAG TPA: hypothetical protein PLY44_03630 [Candidatus Pacearchaeota archaeon]|nr:hypothetical protein [Candidatus Pacearchaeota archaeon]